MCLILLLGACAHKGGRASGPRWLKGQLHAHSSNSGDSETPPGAVARWYAEHGFDFVVMTDHNVAGGEPAPGILILPGAELTTNLQTCEPPPDPGDLCLLHVNALVVDGAQPRPVELGIESARREDVYGAEIAWATAHGGLAQINHPNFEAGADAALVAALARRGAALVEIANQGWDSGNAGDATHPSTEALWDAVLSQGVLIYGTATDDAHHYDDADAVRAAGQRPYPPGLGFVMVRAEPQAAAIRAALARGDFYASTGLQLARAGVEGGALRVAVAPGQAGPFHIRFIGQGGRVLAERDGAEARFALHDAPPGYLRAVVTGPGAATAWVQPVRVGR